MLRFGLLDVDLRTYYRPDEVHLSYKPRPHIHLEFWPTNNHYEPRNPRPLFLYGQFYANAALNSPRDIEEGHEEAINSRPKLAVQFLRQRTFLIFSELSVMMRESARVEFST